MLAFILLAQSDSPPFGGDRPLKGMVATPSQRWSQTVQAVVFFVFVAAGGAVGSMFSCWRIRTRILFLSVVVAVIAVMATAVANLIEK